MYNKISIILCIMLLALSGCLTTRSTADLPDIKRIQGPQYPVYQPPRRAEGSLWSELGGMDLYTERIAKRVGDLVTVRIVEDPEANLGANTKTSRSSSLSAAKLKFLGYMKVLSLKNAKLAQNPGTDDLFSAELASKFDGKGTSDRDGHVKAYVSCVVVRILPNGNLYINGKREIKVNNEIQYITLTGFVRPEDISTTNEIASTFVADARIAYSGIGPLADKQKPGWLGRVIDYVWPF